MDVAALAPLLRTYDAKMHRLLPHRPREGWSWKVDNILWRQELRLQVYCPLVKRCSQKSNSWSPSIFVKNSNCKQINISSKLQIIK